MSNVTLHLGDCLAILPTLTGISAVVTDPPYGIGYDASHSHFFGKGIARREATWDVEPFDPAPILALGLPTILWGANNYPERLPHGRNAWLCWVKTMRNYSENRQADMELAWTNCINRPRVFRHLWVGAYRDSENGIRNVHPTQKPIQLMTWCIELISKPGDTILDPFMGSGTTGVACVKTGRNFIGIELDPGYFAIAQKRIEQAQMQLPLLEVT